MEKKIIGWKNEKKKYVCLGGGGCLFELINTTP